MGSYRYCVSYINGHYYRNYVGCYVFESWVFYDLGLLVIRSFNKMCRTCRI